MDVKGRVTKLRDPKGNETNLSYFDTDQVKSVTDAANGVADQHIDGDGNRDSLTDPNRNTTNFAHTSKKKLASEKPQVGGPVAYTYNALQLLVTRKNSRDQNERFTYDKNGWLTSVDFDEKTWRYLYDANGNVLTVSGTDGNIIRTYDELNRVTSYTDPLGNVIKYGYDKAGNLTTLTYPGNLVVTYAYNLDNRLETVTDWKGRVLVRYDYTVDGKLKKETRNNGTVREYTYGYAGRNLNVGELTTITDKVLATGQVIASYGFTYDAAGNITNEATVPEPTLDVLKISAATMTYTGDNRLATYNAQAVSYDADGNMTNGPLGTGFAAFSYDTRNRLTQAGTTQYTYTVENHRIRVNQNGQNTTYVINPHAALSQALIKRDPDGKQTYYIYGNGLLAQIVDNATTFYHYDLRGSTVAMTNDTASITDRFTYLPYGKLISHSGITTSPFLYSGKYGVFFDGNDLYYMRSRFYNINTYAFLNRDTIIGGVGLTGSLNRYSYAFGNPVIFNDPNGMFPFSVYLSHFASKGAAFLSSKISAKNIDFKKYSHPKTKQAISHIHLSTDKYEKNSGDVITNVASAALQKAELAATYTGNAELGSRLKFSGGLLGLANSINNVAYAYKKEESIPKQIAIEACSAGGAWAAGEACLGLSAFAGPAAVPVALISVPLCSIAGGVMGGKTCEYGLNIDSDPYYYMQSQKLQFNGVDVGIPMGIFMIHPESLMVY